MTKTIYLDHAATTPLDSEVLQKMMPYLTEAYGNADSPHAVGRRAMLAVDTARDTVARLLNAKPNEIYFTSGGTESDNWAILGAAYAGRKVGKRHVLLSAVEHHAALYCAQRLQSEGFEVEYLPVTKAGVVEAQTLQERVREDTALVCVMAANNETGAVFQTKTLAEIAHGAGALFFADCVQLAPHQAIDVKELGADLLSLSAHKFYGPKGAGALYIKSGVKIEKHVGGGEQERGLRGGTLNVPAIVGLACALEKTARELPARQEKIRLLRERFLQEIASLGGVFVNGEGLPSVLNLRVAGVKNDTLLYRLDLEGVAVAAGSACASASVKPSHVLTAMGLSDEEARECVRISFGKDNTEEEIVRAAAIFVKAVNAVRQGD
jgi:cysteine desulfurase